jgi:hypothetical protein
MLTLAHCISTTKIKTPPILKTKLKAENFCIKTEEQNNVESLADEL